MQSSFQLDAALFPNYSRYFSIEFGLMMVFIVAVGFPFASLYKLNSIQMEYLMNMHYTVITLSV